MLGKLLKYELKSTARSFLPLYGALVLLAVISSFFYHLQDKMQWLFGISTALLFAVLFGMLVFTLVAIIQRFYSNLLKDEGYLTFTLPVKTSSIINSKLIAAFIWSVASALIALVCFGIFMFGVSGLSLSELGTLVQEFFTKYWNPLWALMKGNGWLVFEIIFTGIVWSIAFILQLYVSMSIGQLPPFAKRRVGFSVLAYIVIYLAIQFALTPITFMFTNGTPSLQLVTNIILITNLITGVLFYLGTYFILKKKLNLE